MTLSRTALYDAHVAMGGRIVPFAGYEMPVQYSSIIAESKAVREGVGMFDVSHMARLRVNGPGALAFLEKVTTNDVANLGDWEGQYSLMLNENGGTVDDLIVFKDTDDAYRVVVNASNHEKDVAWMRSHLPEDATLTDETDETVMIAVQGPTAGKLVAGASDRPEAVNAVPFFGSIEMLVFGIPCYATRSGYTGEDGFELVCAAERGIELWDALANAGAAPCGLASRDTLRVEAGLPLYGHELTDEINPITAGLG
ncbi:glycine cleavage system aminomethyltransferase GcvT, partial [bacterium]